MSKKSDNSVIKFGVIFIASFICFFILYIGSSFIIPFILSVLLAFAILAVSSFFKERFKMNSFFAMIFSFATYILLFFIVGNIISSNINELIKLTPSYQMKITSMFSHFLNFFKIDNSDELTKLVFGNLNFQQILTTVTGNITSLLSNAGIIFFYTMFILLESRNFKLKWVIMFPEKIKREHIYETIEKVKTDIKSYFFIKTLASLLVGLLSYFVMVSFSLNLAMFWALLIFFLNFIPFVGSIIAVLFPSLLSFIQPDFTVYSSIMMIFFLVLAQTFVGNFFEPKLMGNRLNLSPLVIIISLSFWSIIWGFWGMVLSIPIMVTINIFLSRIEQTRPLAILLSEKGNLKVSAIKKEKKQKFLNKIFK